MQCTEEVIFSKNYLCYFLCTAEDSSILIYLMISKAKFVRYICCVSILLGLSLFKLIIIHYHTSKQSKIKFKPMKILNHKISASINDRTELNET